MQKCIVLAYFVKFFKNQAWNFRAVGRKTQRAENFWEIFQKTARKLQNVLFLHIFQNSWKNHALNFRAFGRKTPMVREILRKVWIFWRKLNRKMILLLFLGKLLLKIDPWKIISDFFNNFPDFEGAAFPCSPCRHLSFIYRTYIFIRVFTNWNCRRYSRMEKAS